MMIDELQVRRLGIDFLPILACSDHFGLHLGRPIDVNYDFLRFDVERVVALYCSHKIFECLREITPDTKQMISSSSRILMMLGILFLFYKAIIADDLFMDEVIHGQPPYIFKSFDYQAFANWKHFDMLDKLVYLLGYQDIWLFYKEYQYIQAASAAKDTMVASETSHAEPYVTEEMWSRFLEEYQSPEKIISIWEECDADHDGIMTLTEYNICRGDYDAYGNASDVNEYDLRANGMIASFEELIRSGEPIPGRYVYDENGIIIDDL